MLAAGLVRSGISLRFEFAHPPWVRRSSTFSCAPRPPGGLGSLAHFPIESCPLLVDPQVHLCQIRAWESVLPVADLPVREVFRLTQAPHCNDPGLRKLYPVMYVTVTIKWILRNHPQSRTWALRLAACPSLWELLPQNYCDHFHALKNSVNPYESISKQHVAQFCLFLRFIKTVSYSVVFCFVSAFIWGFLFFTPFLLLGSIFIAADGCRSIPTLDNILVCGFFAFVH